MSVNEHFKAFYETWFADREVYVRSHGSVRYITLSARLQLIGVVCAAFIGGWVVFSAMQTFLVEHRFVSEDQQVQAMRDAYESRLNRIRDRYDRLEAELDDSEKRFDKAMAQLSGKHGQLENQAGVELALQGSVEALRRRLREVSDERDEVAIRLDEIRLRARYMEQKFAEAQQLSDQRQASLNDFVSTLDSTAAERDEARVRVRALTSEVTNLNRKVEQIRKHQAQIMAQLEEAVKESMALLNGVLSKSGVDVEFLIKEIERTYSGEGGPFTPLIYNTPDAVKDFPANEEAVSDILRDLLELNALGIAVRKLPLGQPIRDTYRFTSGFGPRRHPITKKWAPHYGIDLAAPKGTPILAPADGVVDFSGRQQGYGEVIKIKHSLGYSTVYAHLHKRHAHKGEMISRGDLIGEVGNTGRSTGNHLHYEIHRYGKPFNPRRFIEAGRNVFED
jgi:murein DD-endopeptidase MepM/ murein hydrolase activator NlpD